MQNPDKIAIAAYRNWAAQQASLPLYWQPDWLDIVAPGKWCAASDDWAQPTWVWPYVARKRLGQRMLQLPPATPYLGPMLLSDSASPPVLPAEIKYGIYTLKQPAAAWQLPVTPRAMATLQLDLQATPKLSPKRSQRLRAINKLVRCSIGQPQDWPELEALLAHQQNTVPAECARIFRQVLAAELGQIWLARDAAGKLQAALGMVWDTSTVYGSFFARQPEAHQFTGLLLYHTAIDELRGKGHQVLDFQAGFLSGSRALFIRLGAKPTWYAQVRAARGPFMKLAEAIRSRTNSKRI